MIRGDSGSRGDGDGGGDSGSRGDGDGGGDSGSRVGGDDVLVCLLFIQ